MPFHLIWIKTWVPEALPLGGFSPRDTSLARDAESITKKTFTTKCSSQTGHMSVKTISGAHHGGSGAPEAAPITQVVPSPAAPTCPWHSSHASLLPVPHTGQLQTLCIGQSPAWIFPMKVWLLPNIRDVVYGASSMLGPCCTSLRHLPGWAPCQALSCFHHGSSHHLVLSGLVTSFASYLLSSSFKI